MPRDEKEALLQKAARIITAGRDDIAFVYAHGSFLEDTPFGDIDLALYLAVKQPPDKNRVIKDELDLEVELQEKLGFPFDVRIINNAPLSFCYNVIKHGRLIIDADEESRVGFVTYTIKRYLDFLPFRKRYLKEVIGLEV